MGSDGQQIGGGAVSRGLSLVYSEICMFKQIYTKIQSICSLKKSENDLRFERPYYSKHYVYQKGYGYGN